ncbi:hypothetical protein SCOR_10205 [Sulfidibacter corallicola]
MITCAVILLSFLAAPESATTAGPHPGPILTYHDVMRPRSYQPYITTMDLREERHRKRGMDKLEVPGTGIVVELITSGPYGANIRITYPDGRTVHHVLSLNSQVTEATDNGFFILKLIELDDQPGSKKRVNYSWIRLETTLFKL